ncbi:MAG: malonate transporter [Oceanicoccus sp.]|jgi:malonate transporter
MNDFYSILTALGPVFSLVFIGYIMGRTAFPSTDFWPSAEHFTYYFLFPTLLVLKIGNATLPGEDLTNVVLLLVLLCILGTLLSFLLGKVVEKENRRVTSIIQGGIRFNTYVGLASASALFGEQGLLWGAVFLAIMIPTVNFACIACYAILLPDKRSSLLKSFYLGVIKNPLIVACIFGALLNISGIGIPKLATPLMSLIGAMALPLGLLAVGVGLDFKLLRKSAASLWAAACFKLIVYPSLFMTLALFFEIPANAKPVLFLFALLPTAPSAYILARQLKGDAPLMAAIITLQTLVAMISMPLMLLMKDLF